MAKTQKCWTRPRKDGSKYTACAGFERPDKAKKAKAKARKRRGGRLLSKTAKRKTKKKTVAYKPMRMKTKTTRGFKPIIIFLPNLIRKIFNLIREFLVISTFLQNDE